MKPLCRTLLLALLALWFAGATAAEEQPPLPPGMTQAQFTQFVDTLARAVAQKLEEKGIVPAATSKDRAASAGNTRAASRDDAAVDATSAWVSAFASRAKVVLSAFPALGGEFARIPALLDQGGHNGRGLWDFTVLLLVASIAAVGVEGTLRMASRRWRLRLQAGAAHTIALAQRWPALIGLTALDVAGLAAVWLVAYAAIGIWFPRSDDQAQFAAAILTAIFSWRLYLLPFRIVLRPGLPGARIAAIPDVDARVVFRCVSIVAFVIIGFRLTHRLLAAIGASPEAIAAGQLPAAVLALTVFAWGAYASRHAVRSWLAGVAKPDGITAALVRHWLAIALPFFTFLALTQIYGAISLQIEVPTTLLLTFNLVVALIFFETLVAYFARDAAPAGNAASAPPLHSRHLILRCLRVAVLIIAAGIIARAWLVDVLAILDPKGWRALTHAFILSGGTLFAAFIAWEIVEHIARRYMSASSDSGASPASNSEATRLATIMPMLRIGMMVLICLVALLTVLSELGVNIAPILAGASVFGLAISFGSQTLVRDIVSGIFYLADDAFRVGEYIDCGKAKGTVESFTMRSVRLRHQNGPVHTIPFGQLGQITNFSRDWSIVKFALRFMGDTDLEKLRKIVKNIGIEMMEDPDLKGEILDPLKMMGVVDIADGALVVRFKFTARPGNPTIIQRNALKRMVPAFQAAGIVFGNAYVSVQTAGAPVEPATGAAANLAVAKQRAESAAVGS